MLIIKEETYKMQTAEKFVTSKLSLEELVEKNTKLERIAELATQLLDTYGDEFASYNEKQYVIDKLSEGVLEYEMFLDR